LYTLSVSLANLPKHAIIDGMRRTSTAPPGPTTDDIRRYMEALPAMGSIPPINERAAQAARSVLGSSDPTWEQRIQAQIDAITKEVVAHLDRDHVSGRYVITDIELRGIIARAISRVAGQFAIDIGQTLAGVNELSTQFDILAQPADDDSPTQYEQPDFQQEG
jgi:hypothetical protein